MISKSQKTKKKNQQEYLIHDNGGRPFKVKITNTNVKVYKLISYETDTYSDNAILSFDVKKCFIGNSPKNDMTLFSGGYGKKFYGNSILLHIKDNEYVYIGSEIYSFQSNGEIIKYVSPVGNSDVPYPYAIDKNNNIYLMIENVILTNETVKNNNNFDPYNIYYDKSKIYNFKDDMFYINDECYNFNYNPYPLEDYKRLTRDQQKIYLKVQNKKQLLTKNDYIKLLNDYGKKKGFLPIKKKILQKRL
jgi:hypothetical protein